MVKVINYLSIEEHELNEVNVSIHFHNKVSVYKFNLTRYY